MSNLCNEKTVIDNTNCTGRKMPVQSIILNFRDASKNISQIKPDKLFRASSLTAYQDNNAALIQLRQSGIKTIIDLRAKREVQKNPYSGSFQGEFNCINIPLDPWNQPEWFIEEAKTIYSGHRGRSRA